MKKFTVIGLSLAAGLLGGVLSQYLIFTPSVRAQMPILAPREVRAQSFTLVNNKGEIGGTFSFDDQGRPIIRLFNNGREIWKAGGTAGPFKPLGN